MRILCLDVGKKRIGLAVSDELGYTAQGLDTLQRQNIDRDINRLKEIITQYNIDRIVIGLPLNMDGTLGRSVKDVIDFTEILKGKIDLPIKTWDERLTSQQAERLLLEADISRKKRRRSLDKIAAQLILQSYLDTENKG